MAEALEVVIGRDDVNGGYYKFDLTKAPHVLVAGTTGSGKSVFLNSILVQLINDFNEKKLNIYIGDPKRVEFIDFEAAPQVKMVCNSANVAEEHDYMLQRLCKMMDDRYDRMRDMGIKNMKSHPGAPNIVCVIDEYGDLVLDKTCGKRIMNSVVRLVQLGRAAGITMILATQRPTVKVMDGLIKANCPFRVALKVISRVDSRVILDQGGADKLNGMGDMLVMNPYEQELTRLQGLYFSDKDICGQIGYARARSNGTV